MIGSEDGDLTTSEVACNNYLMRETGEPERFECECGRHYLTVHPDLDGGRIVEAWDFGPALTFRERLRSAWSYLRGGNVHLGEFILPPETVRRFVVRLEDDE